MADEDEDEAELIALGQRLVAIDIDAAHADQIVRRGHHGIARGPSAFRFVEPFATAALTGSYLVWAFLKAIELYR